MFGGTPVDEGKYPFAVSIRTNFQKHNCGGSLLNPYWVVTAGHCVYNTTINSVALGSVYLEKQITIPTSIIILHPMYHPSLINDIALIKLSQPVLSTYILLGDAPVGSVLTAVGWGLTNNGILSHQLQKIYVSNIDVSNCQYVYKNFINEANICTIGGKGRGVCRGDSGGALIFNDRLVGITSFTGKDCGKGFPDVFTRIAPYENWIMNKMQEN